MKSKLHIRKIDTPEDIAIGPNGEPGWIKINTRLKKKHTALMNRGIEYAAKLQSLDLDDDATESEMGPEAWAALANVMRYTDKDQLKFYSHFVADWNWTDEETGELLGKPNKMAVFGELFEEQIAWLQKQYNLLQKYRSTEGNAETGSG